MSMVTCDFTLIPIGTDAASVSHYLQGIGAILNRYPLNYEISGMATSLEGDIDTVWHAIRAVQESLFEMGLDRVYTVIKIDDRRDKETSLAHKKKAVMSP